jgi:hypothetical protein
MIMGIKKTDYQPHFCRWCRPHQPFSKLKDMQDHAMREHRDVLYPKKEKPPEGGDSPAQDASSS